MAQDIWNEFYCCVCAWRGGELPLRDPFVDSRVAAVYGGLLWSVAYVCQFPHSVLYFEIDV